MRTIIVLIVAAALLTVCALGYAADIVTMPTANQLKAGQVDVAYYFINLDLPPQAPQFLHAQTVYVGVTDELELDFHRYDPEASKDMTWVSVNASLAIQRETVTKPDIVIGGRNIFGDQTTLGPAAPANKRSYFLCFAKTLNLPPAGPPKPPFVRLHLSAGTDDPSILGEDRHGGLFGGIQALLTPEIGAIALHDGQDAILGITYTPVRSHYTIKGGTFGKHWWLGLSYAR